MCFLLVTILDIICSCIVELYMHFVMKDVGDHITFSGFNLCARLMVFFYDDTSMFMIVSRSFIFTLSNWCTNCTCFSDDFTLIDGELLVNPSGCWAWLAHYSTSMIRLDITNIVHVIFWFMHTFHTTYMHVMKRVFTYLQGKTEHGLSFKFQGKLKNEFFRCIVMLIRLMPMK